MTCAKRGPLPGAGLYVAALLCLMVVAPSPASAEPAPFGRLFTSPEERAELDRIRYAKRPDKPRAADKPRVAPVPEAEPEVVLKGFRYDGMVRRSGGPATAWVDGRPVLVGAADEQGLELDLPDTRSPDLQVNLPRHAEPVTLQPGQVFDPGPAGIPYAGGQRDGQP